MLDFMEPKFRLTRNGCEIYPAFKTRGIKDLMIRGGDFYAVWDEETGLWSTSQDRATELMDISLEEYARAHPELVSPKILGFKYSETGSIDKWKKYIKQQLTDRYTELDTRLIFQDQPTCREDFASKRLPYSLVDGDHSAFDDLLNTLYSEEESYKIKWAIGCIASGDSVNVQKFFVLYGAAGTGKSTILNIVENLFRGYSTTFDAKALGTGKSEFALEPFKDNPLVAIQHDGDLSRIEDNTKLNSIVSHEYLVVNEKHKAQYRMKFNTMLFIGTNQPVKITDTKSGLLRRLVDISPTGNKLPITKYRELTTRVEYELGAIAKYCMDIYMANPRYFDGYVPVTMIGETNSLYDFVLDSYDIFSKEDQTTLGNAWKMYKDYVEDSMVTYKLDRMKFKAELKSYFREFEDRAWTEAGGRVRNLYSGFIKDKFTYVPELPKSVEKKADWLQMAQYESVFDKVCAGYYAQPATPDGKPTMPWDKVTTTLNKLDTHELHYVRVPENHIVIDFDLKDSKGEKSLNANLRAAAKFPPTYAELSKSGQGIHLHYIYKGGDPKKLSRIFDENIEVKVFTGKSSLRRKLTACNQLDISEISSGLPFKEVIKTIDKDILKNEKQIRKMILRNLNKEYHAYTAPSIDFIKKILDEAYESGIPYDVRDMKQAILQFAASSSNQADKCLKTVAQMKFVSGDIQPENKPKTPNLGDIPDVDKPLIMLDVEVYPNLFVVSYGRVDEPDDKIVSLVNPTPIEIQSIIDNYRIGGFNCRNYDNEIMYARTLGVDNYGLFELSQKIIKNRFEGHRESKNLSWIDVFDMCSEKMSLKKWEIRLGSPHKEMDIPWDQPVPDDKIEEVVDYNRKDVAATKRVWEANQPDFLAREILSKLSGLPVNASNNEHTTKIIFGNDKNPQSEFNYRNLGELHDDDYTVDGDEFTRFNASGQPVFPGYTFDIFREPKSIYRDQDVGEGGFVWAEPGMYGRTKTFDVMSMHPTSMIMEELFGKYTAKLKMLLDARLAVKHGDLKKASELLGMDVTMYEGDKVKIKALSKALKIVINSIYGLTAAKFKCAFKDPRNTDNIVAKRGALFMINLLNKVLQAGGKVIHIKTDSIKVVDPDDRIEKLILDYGKLYGYSFEVEHVFEKICLVNNAVYIGKLAEDDPEDPGKWEATGAQFAVPYVFKTLFSHEEILFDDMCETKSVKTSMSLDFNEDLPEGEHNYKFVGRVGLFTPVKEGAGGGVLVRENGDKYDAVVGTKGYRWLESEDVKALGKQDCVDISYYRRLVDEAVENIAQFGDISWFLGDN